MLRQQRKIGTAVRLVVLAAAALLATEAGGAADPPKEVASPAIDGGVDAVRGNWIVRGYPHGGVLALMKIDGRDGRPEATLLAVGFPGYAQSKVEDLRVDDRSVGFQVRIDNGRPAEARTVQVVAYRPGGQRAPDVLLGSMEVNGSRSPARLERTDREALDPKDVGAPGPLADEWRRLDRAEEIGEKKRIVDGILAKYPEGPFAFSAESYLVVALANAGAPKDQILAAADRSIRLAAPHGRELELFAVHKVAWRLAEAEGLAGVAADYARRAEAMVQPTDPVGVRASVLKTLASALRRAGKGDEAGAAADRAAGFDEILDRASSQRAPTVKAEPFAGRRGPGGRAVLMEMFTGARCGPCVRADAAFDALIGSYRPQDVIFIQYHVHIPGFDALTNGGSEERGRYYRAIYAPFACVDGRDIRLIGLASGTDEAGYRAIRRSIEARMDAAPGAGLVLEAERRGDKLDIRAEVTRLKTTGDSVRLRFVLVEREVRYEGNNGVRLNHHVARAFPGGPRGIALNAESAKHAVTVDLAEVVGDLNRYLDGFADRRYYPDNYRPTGLGSLGVVAVIQDDATQEVLQAAEVKVPDSR